MRIGDKSIAELSDVHSEAEFPAPSNPSSVRAIAAPSSPRSRRPAHFPADAGPDHLTLCGAGTLPRGTASAWPRRSARPVGVLYVLDEPSDRPAPALTTRKVIATLDPRQPATRLSSSNIDEETMWKARTGSHTVPAR